jgi:hypothetical protein
LRKEIVAGQELAISYRALLHDTKGRLTSTWTRDKTTITPVALGSLLIQSLRSTHDSVLSANWFTHEHAAKTVDERSELSARFGEKDGHVGPLMLHIQYVANEWLFVRESIIKAGDQTFSIKWDLANAKRDNGAGQIWEWITTNGDGQEDKIVDTLVAARSGTLRHRGANYTKDIPITTTDVRRLQEVSLARQAMIVGMTAPTLSAAPKKKASTHSKSSSAPAQSDDDKARRLKAQLANAKSLAKAGVYAAAEKKFRQIITESPGTEFAAEAKKELDSLPPH